MDLAILTLYIITYMANGIRSTRSSATYLTFFFTLLRRKASIWNIHESFDRPRRRVPLQAFLTSLEGTNGCIGRRNRSKVQLICPCRSAFLLSFVAPGIGWRAASASQPPDPKGMQGPPTYVILFWRCGETGPAQPSNPAAQQAQQTQQIQPAAPAFGTLGRAA